MSSSSSSTMMISGAALLGVAAALAIFVRRRQLAQAETDAEQQQLQHGFEMMSDKAAVLA
jgi:MYXO-CTERM domain-containing protein